jgi:hypothetical protein
MKPLLKIRSYPEGKFFTVWLFADDNGVTECLLWNDLTPDKAVLLRLWALEAGWEVIEDRGLIAGMEPTPGTQASRPRIERKPKRKKR